MNYEINMSLGELKKRTSRVAYKPIKFLSAESAQVKSLSKSQMEVLRHLCLAAACFDSVSFKLNNVHNIPFLHYLNEQIKKKDDRAPLAKKMLLSQKSIFSPDALGRPTALAVGIKKTDGLGYYPEDMTESEFVIKVKRMLDLGKTNEVKAVLSARTIVERESDLLKAVDFVDAFAELSDAAREIRLAAECCENGKFKKFLMLQAKALEVADEKLDAEADTLWAELGPDEPIEFTITRECYDDKMTSSVFSDKKLAKKLKQLKIEVHSKDCLGARVGLVSRRGTAELNKLKKFSEVAEKVMPYHDEYAHSSKKPSKQMAVDVDLVALTGDEGAYRAGIVLAQNLPNDDKLSLKMGGGRRNVYHRQVRANMNKKLFKNLICDEQFKYFSAHAEHLGTICHENTHSLGPISSNALGKLSEIFEEFKADMGMYAFLDELEEAKIFTENECKQIIVTCLSNSFLKGKPSLEEAHRVRSVMICNRMINSGAISVSHEGRLKFDFELAKRTSKQMLSEVIRLQLDGNNEAAEEYKDKWFVWSDELERVSKLILRFSKKLNGYLIQPLFEDFVKNSSYHFC